jgi:hypothetical protein
MAFTPTSRVYLLDTPLDNTYKNQIDFTDTASQYDYFISKRRHTFENITYIRKDNKISVGAHIDDLWDCNYVMYQNKNFDSKWFYAFITRMEYVNPNCTDIYIETDVYQTWLSECNLLHSFVVREHVEDDTIGANIVDEGLEIGDYVVNNYVQLDDLSEIWFVLAVSDTISDSDTVIRGIYGNIYSGLAYFVYSPSDYQALSNHINNYVNAGKGDAIQFIYTIPKAILPTGTVSGSVIPNGTDQGIYSYEYKTFSGSIDEQAKFKHLDEYSPTNKKLYCYPYNFLYVSNNNGGYAEYRFENFVDFENSPNIKFFVDGSITPNPTMLMYPMFYKLSNEANSLYSPEYGLRLSGYPFCSWASDTFNAWLAQNALQTGVAVVASTGAVIGGIAMGNIPAVVGGAIGIASEMSQVYKASIQPDQAKGDTNSGSLNVSTGRQTFSISRMSIKKSVAERIDNFFTMFGYKVNTLKIPKIRTRKNWNYIQTIDVNIDGAIPDEDMRKLKDMYNKGVTFWHNPERFCNYNYSNDII